jgi:DNA polymerase-3 subunit epsilon|nr:DNA polymerase III subunit epsilon [Neorhizobium tomejilense]
MADTNLVPVSAGKNLPQTSGKRAFALDTETTGLSHKDGDRVIEIGAVEIVGNMPTDNTFHMYINPGRRKVHPDALAVHGITDEFLADKPTMDEVMPLFLEFIGGDPLIIHNAPFDRGFLNAELRLLQKSKVRTFPQELGNEIIDTLDIARRRFPLARNTLDGLCTRFGVDSTNRVLHGALIDADLLANVYIHLMGLTQLDLGDHPGRGQAMNMSIGALVSASSNRPVRPARPAISPSDSENDRHAAFLGKIKNPVWSKFF